MPIERLSILDYSDREFLLICRDVAEADGWFESEDVAVQMGLVSRRLASSRLSWLKRYEAVDREVERDHTGAIKVHRNGKVRHTQRWRLTPLGESLALGKLRKGDQRALEGMNDGQMLLAVRWMAEHSADDSGMSKLLIREWRYGHGRY